MAILRAAYLSDPGLSGNGPTLLLTYNTALAKYIRSLAKDVLNQVNVMHYHQFAKEILIAKGCRWALLGSDQRDALLRKAVAIGSTKNPGSPVFKWPYEVFSDELTWISQQGITSKESYVQVQRSGRATVRLLRVHRPVVWEVYETYLRMRTELGKDYDLDDLPSFVTQLLESKGQSSHYKHIILDEGQDLSPVMVRSLARALAPEGSLSFFGDYAQQIYGRCLSWRAIGLTITKQERQIWEFKENYRNSKEIAHLALAIATMPYFREVADMVAPNEPRAEGPKPTLVQFPSQDQEMRAVVTKALRLAETGTTVILLRGEALGQYSGLLQNQAYHLKGDVETPHRQAGLFYGTYHSAKGLEFDTVFLPQLSATDFPKAEDTALYGEEEATSNDGRLLYVGVTRARSNLILTYSGEKSWMLPEDESLYTSKVVK